MCHFKGILNKKVTGLISHYWNFPVISKKEKMITRFLSIKIEKSFVAKERQYTRAKLEVVWWWQLSNLRGNETHGGGWAVRFLGFKEKYFIDRYLSLSILMSNGPSFCREKPLSGVSNCIEEQPASRRTPSRVPGSTPEEINKASDWLNCPRRARICFL